MPMFEYNSDLAEDSDHEGFQAPPAPLRQPRTNSAAKPITIPSPAAPASYRSRRLSEESIQTDLCEGPLLDSPPRPLSRPLSPYLSSSPPTQHRQQHHQYLPYSHNQQDLALQLPSASSEQPPTTTPPTREASAPVSDRAELIERLKRGESPTWVPNRRLESLFHRQTSSRSPTRSPRPPSSDHVTTTTTVSGLLPAADVTPERASLEARGPDTEAAARLQDGLNIERPRSALHSGDFTQNAPEANHLHSLSDEVQPRSPSRGGDPSVADRSAWVATSPPRQYAAFHGARRIIPTPSLAQIDTFRSDVSLSSSVSSSFVYKPPTSPLVQSESNDNNGDDDAGGTYASVHRSLDALETAIAESPLGNSRANMRSNMRRHTMNFAPPSHTNPPPSSSPFPLLSLSSPSSRPADSHIVSRRENVFPYQAHQPRRSLASVLGHHYQHGYPGSSPQTPVFPRSRRPSFSSDTSPIQHASMVGSYEESILRGRMSTTPSKPLDFLAQIGVLGLGAKCKPNLRCPPHVTLPFSAVFYSYATTSYGRSKMEDGPSPYVGMVDLENGLPNLEAEQRSKRRLRLQSRSRPRTQQAEQRGSIPIASATSFAEGGPDKDLPDSALGSDKGNNAGAASADADAVMDDATSDMYGLVGPSSNASTVPDSGVPRRHRGRGSHSPKAPPGGSYRIPPQGQLQIIIKNQNKTAVKLFLVPYDLTGMEPGTKTFIRQRSYSAGPIIDSMPTLGGLSLSERPILRYLIHLHICCPSRGRYYLYKSIRVVFANRVPDGKEKLRNELTFPEPRYAPYKPIRVMYPPMGNMMGAGFGTVDSGPGPGSMLAAEKAYRRRSSGLSITADALHAFDGLGRPSPPPVPMPRYLASSWQASNRSQSTVDAASFGFANNNMPVDPFPLGPLKSPVSSPNSLVISRPTSSAAGAATTADSGPTASRSAMGEERNDAADNAGQSPPLYNKLNKGDFGYGGNAFVALANGSSAPAESLLSQRLRSLEVQIKQSSDKFAEDATHFLDM